MVVFASTLSGANDLIVAVVCAAVFGLLGYFLGKRKTKKRADAAPKQDEDE